MRKLGRKSKPGADVVGDNGVGLPDVPTELGGVPLIDIGSDGGGNGTGDSGADSDSGSDSGTGTGARKRGRPAGSRSKPRSLPVDQLEGIERILLSVHTMGAAMLQFPDLAISPDEAHAITTAGAAVLEHYPNVQLAAKTAAWVNFIGVIGFTYGTRAFAFARSKKAKPAPAPAPIQFPSVNFN